MVKLYYVRAGLLPGTGWFWFEADRPGQDPGPDTLVHGPFLTEEECNAHQRATLGGPETEVEEIDIKKVN